MGRSGEGSPTEFLQLNLPLSQGLYIHPCSLAPTSSYAGSFQGAEVSAGALRSVPRVQWVLTNKAEKGTFLTIELAFPRRVGPCHLEVVAKASSPGLAKSGASGASLPLALLSPSCRRVLTEWEWGGARPRAGKAGVPGGTRDGGVRGLGGERAPVGKRADGDPGDYAEGRGDCSAREPEAGGSSECPPAQQAPRPQTPACSPAGTSQALEFPKHGPSGGSPRLGRVLRDLGSMAVFVLAPTLRPLWASVPKPNSLGAGGGGVACADCELAAWA